VSPGWERNPEIHRGRTVVCSLHAHFVFTPKYRRGPFTREILARCEEIMRDGCADFGAELREFNGEADHVHLLGEHFWSPSCFAASCGGAPLAIIKEYIEQQKRPA
jgi:putative transposase